MIDPNDTTNIIDLWYKHEQIAMHFNELLIQYRLQMFAGLGAFSSLAVFLLGVQFKVKTENQEGLSIENLDRLRFYTAIVVTVVFFAASLLDIFYYSRLLSGAVKAIIELEAAHPFIQLSTTIKERASDIYKPILSYLLIFLVLVAATARLGYQAYKKCGACLVLGISFLLTTGCAALYLFE